MKTVNLLLGNSEELLNSLIETTVKEVCGQQAVLRCSKTAWIEELVDRSRDNGYDLLILIPDNLLSAPGAPPPTTGLRRSLDAVRTLRSATSMPIIALPVCDRQRQTERLLLEAGANCVLELPFDLDELKTAVRRLVKLPPPSGQSSPGRWSFADAVMHPIEHPIVSS